jgi:hypothetical protein
MMFINSSQIRRDNYVRQRSQASHGCGNAAGMEQPRLVGVSESDFS